MSKFSEAKDINISTLHICNQIVNLIDHISSDFSADITIETLNNLTLLREAMNYAPEKLYKVFGNNIVKTNFLPFANGIFVTYLKDRSDLHVKLIFHAIVHLMWNLSDVSEMFCKEAASCQDLLENLCLLTHEMEYDEENRDLINATLGFIGNIVRRESFHTIFSSYLIFPLIIKVIQSSFTDCGILILVTSIICYTTPSPWPPQLSQLANTMLGVIVETLVGASNNAQHRFLGFSAVELLDLLPILCASDDARAAAGASETLRQTLLQLLGQGFCVGRVVAVARAVYTDGDFQGFARAYDDKYGRSDATVVAAFSPALD